MKVKQNIQVLIKMIGIVVISSIVLVGLLCLVYKLPKKSHGRACYRIRQYDPFAK